MSSSVSTCLVSIALIALLIPRRTSSDAYLQLKKYSGSGSLGSMKKMSAWGPGVLNYAETQFSMVN